MPAQYTLSWAICSIQALPPRELQGEKRYAFLSHSSAWDAMQNGSSFTFPSRKIAHLAFKTKTKNHQHA